MNEEEEAQAQRKESIDNFISSPVCLTENTEAMDVGKREVLNAQAIVWKNTLSVLDSVVLKCAMDLEIADTIHNHGQPMTISQLGSSLPKPVTNTGMLRRLMRLLVHSQLFKVQEVDGEELYGLNSASKFLLKDSDKSVLPLLRHLLQMGTLQPYYALGRSLEGDAKTTAFKLVRGESEWEYCSTHPEYNRTFNEAMECEARTVTPALINGCKDMFAEIGSLVDVGGGTGTASKAIVKAFPHIKCKALDLPHVVATAPQDTEVEYVAGDMFSYIPNADAVMLMRILHDWDDQECLKILKRCKEAIPKEGGKVIIVDMVIGSNEKTNLGRVKLTLDMMMMAMYNGKERTEKEWRRLLSDAGFTRVMITPIMAVQSVIEAYP